MLYFLIIFSLLLSPNFVKAEGSAYESTGESIKENSTQEQENSSTQQFKNKSAANIFDDKMSLDGYAKEYENESKDVLLAMIKDDSLNNFMMASSIKVFREKFAQEIFSKEKNQIENILIRRLNKTNSTYVQIEISHTLCVINRYQYFPSMIPVLIQKLDHYNKTVNEITYNALTNIIGTENTKTREARIVFNSLRKILFLSRKRLTNIKEPNEVLSQKLKFLRWSIKVLGTDELRRLPKEVVNLL